MKNLLYLTIIFTILLSCKKESSEPFGKIENRVQNPIELGEEIFNVKGNCVSCHQLKDNVIGPSVYDIAKIYREKNGNMVAFLKGDAEPIVDPSQYEVMKVNLELSKTFLDDELKAVEAYFYSSLK